MRELRMFPSYWQPWHFTYGAYLWYFAQLLQSVKRAISFVSWEWSVWSDFRFSKAPTDKEQICWNVFSNLEDEVSQGDKSGLSSETKNLDSAILFRQSQLQKRKGLIRATVLSILSIDFTFMYWMEMILYKTRSSPPLGLCAIFLSWEIVNCEQAAGF